MSTAVKKTIWLPPDLARDAEEQAVDCEPFIIAKAGKPLVKVARLDAPSGSQVNRLGFMAGQIAVPDDFDGIGGATIETRFSESA